VEDPALDRTGAPVDNRREELLRVAADVFARNGYSRSTQRDVADAAGILAGSLYHHFASKESIAIELLNAFHTEIDGVARTSGQPGGDALDVLARFSDSIGAVAERHRAAINLAAFDAPSGAGNELRALARKKLETVDRRWVELLTVARSEGLLRPEIDVPELAAVLGEATFDLAGDFANVRLRELSAYFTTMMLDGITTRPVADDDLDGSPPAAAARAFAQRWADGPADEGSPRRRQILAAAREEFSSRGFTATTMRDLAAASGITASSMYRHFASKQELLDAILGTFSAELTAGYAAVGAASGSAAQRLDALLALMSTAAERFRAEVLIQKEWWWYRDATGSEPRSADNTTRLRLLESILDDGVLSGEFIEDAQPARRSVAVRSTMWIRLGTGASAPDRRHRLLRACLLRGASPSDGP
jgi:AcrR family transcriptional regulator